MVTGDELKQHSLSINIVKKKLKKKKTIMMQKLREMLASEKKKHKSGKWMKVDLALKFTWVPIKIMWRMIKKQKPLEIFFFLFWISTGIQ